MPEMNWTAISATADLVSAIAVIVSLIYLAYQIRQNTRAMEQGDKTAKAASFNISTTGYRENRKIIIENPELAALYLKGSNTPETLDNVERYRYRMLMSNFLDSQLDMYGQTKLTGYSPETWDIQGRRVLRRVVGTKGGLWFWSEFRKDYPPNFVAEVDSAIAQGVSPDVPPAPDR